MICPQALNILSDISSPLLPPYKVQLKGHLPKKASGMTSLAPTWTLRVVLRLCVQSSLPAVLSRTMKGKMDASL